MHGPDPRGPASAQRLSLVVKVALSVAILIGVGLAAWAWNATRTNTPRTALRGDTRPAAAPPAARDEVGRDGASEPDGATVEEAIAASAFVVVDLSTGRAIREQKGEWLDAPVWPGSIAKLATFAAAIDAGVLTDATRVMCTHQLTLPGGRRVDCSHPTLGHALSPVEALANSCNVFTATIARGLTREQLSSGFVRLGLSPVPAGVDLITSAFGLGGAQVAPRKLIEAVRRAANIPLIHDGLRASARVGTSSAFADAGIDALAKTGTAPMKRGGRALGLVAALTPAETPRFGIVVALPGGSGAQAAETAAAILRSVVRLEPRGAATPPFARGTGDAFAALTVGPGPALVWWASNSAQERASAPGAGQAPAVVRMRIGQPTAKGYAVETLDVEEYVARVVAGETSDATPAAAREALAITARTFAMVNRARHADDGFDLCTLTHCQVTRPATRSSRAAAERTRGQVLVDDRDDRDGRNARLAPVFYSASCGGTLADARTLLPNADAASMPWLASRPDPAGVEEVTWQTEIPADDLLRALQQNGSRGDTLRNLIAHAASLAGTGVGASPGGSAGSRAGNDRKAGAPARERTPTPSTPANLGRRRSADSESAANVPASGAASGSGGADASAPRDSRAARVTSAGLGPGIVTHVTTEGLTPSTLSIDDFRRAIGQHLGWQLLKSTRFTVQRTSRGYRFTGRGHGHGVGLCVLGASALAARGDDASRILQAYFPGLQVTTPSTRNMVPLLRTSRAAAATDAASLPAIQLRLPSRDEGERARLMRLIATNLKELALDLSLPSPTSLDVVVHPTVDAYRRATRSPSWTSAATMLAGDDITLHFVPLSVLDRGAMLTQTVRHELVHVLTLRALFDRPRWVHEGLALHFAGERVSAEPEEASDDRVKCPSDRDLMRPRSRDAFDHAYSRAAACVARDLASGRNWRDLGAR
jgi:stage II sporulation protein D